MLFVHWRVWRSYKPGTSWCLDLKGLKGFRLRLSEIQVVFLHESRVFCWFPDHTRLPVQHQALRFSQLKKDISRRTGLFCFIWSIFYFPWVTINILPSFFCILITATPPKVTPPKVALGKLPLTVQISFSKTALNGCSLYITFP